MIYKTQKAPDTPKQECKQGLQFCVPYHVGFGTDLSSMIQKNPNNLLLTFVNDKFEIALELVLNICYNKFSKRRRRTDNMNDYEFRADLETVMDLLDITAVEIADSMGVSPVTVSRWRKNEENVSNSSLNAFYNLAFKKGIRLNKIKEQLFKEECKNNSVILFHGAKSHIEGKISIEKSKDTNDFGKGFYCGESLEQSAMFVANYPESSIYILEFDRAGLSDTQLNVNRDWMLLIAFFRNKLPEYSNHPVILKLLSKLEDADYIIAPIADNRMFEIIDSFIDGEITDVQCQHCLSATNLGNQYVFFSDKALKQLHILRHCFLAPDEKKYYLTSKQEESRIGNDKVKLARRQYRGQGKYIEEILK